MPIALLPPLLLAVIFCLRVATQGCAAFRRRSTGRPGRPTALQLLCTGLLPFAGAAPSTQAGQILQSFVVEVPREFQLSSPAQVTELRGLPLRAVTSIDEAQAPLREVTWYKLVIAIPWGIAMTSWPFYTSAPPTYGRPPPI